MDIRQKVKDAKRIVIKIGSSSITHSETGELHLSKIEKLIRQIADLRGAGKEVVLVSSGAIATGRHSLGINEKPSTLSGKQALAAIGQARLIMEYRKLFSEYNLRIAQILMTKSTITNEIYRENAKATFTQLLVYGAVPIVNENDTISTYEIQFGDNDRLSALVSALVEADLLILLSDIDGLYNKNPQKYTDAKLIELVGDITEDVKNMAGGEGSKFGTGGMITKIIAAEMATKIGTNLVIANGDDPKNITRVVEKENIGTLFVRKNKKISSKKYWLAYGTNKKGIITIDEGAEKALLNGKSLLPVGIKSVEGRFDEGAVIKIENLKKEIIATGITNYSSDEIEVIKGKQSEEIEGILGYQYHADVVHIDNMLVNK